MHDEERFRLRAPLRPLVIGAFVLGAPAVLCVREALRAPDLGTGSLPLFLACLFLLPLAIGGYRVLRGDRTVVLDALGVRIDGTSGHIAQFSWAALAVPELRTVRSGGLVIRAVWLRDASRSFEILEQHTQGPEIFERLVASLVRRHRAGSAH